MQYVIMLTHVDYIYIRGVLEKPCKDLWNAEINVNVNVKPFAWTAILLGMKSVSWVTHNRWVKKQPLVFQVEVWV
jgi:hypothetical protein